MIVYNKDGNEILAKPIKIAEPLDIFSPMKIRPGETFTKVISIEYEPEKPNLRYLKDVKKEDIKVELVFDKVEFSDGSVEFLNYWDLSLNEFIFKMIIMTNKSEMEF